MHFYLLHLQSLHLVKSSLALLLLVLLFWKTGFFEKVKTKKKIERRQVWNYFKMIKATWLLLLCMREEQGLSYNTFEYRLSLPTDLSEPYLPPSQVLSLVLRNWKTVDSLFIFSSLSFPIYKISVFLHIRKKINR